jgi:hypothetical protein
MQRITDSTTAASLPAPPSLSGLTPGYFTGGVPGSTAATRVRYWFLNMVQEELMSLLTAAGITPDTTGTEFTQVLAALQALFAAIGGSASQTFNVAAPTAAAHALNLGHSIGAGATSLSSVTGSRTFGVIYTNSTSRPLLVMIYVGTGSGNGSQTTGCYFYVNGVQVGGSYTGTLVGSEISSMIVAVVPPGGDYELLQEGLNVATISNWTEF